MVCIDDEAFNAGLQQVFHGIGNNGAAIEGQKGLGAPFRKRTQPRSKTRAENKSCFETMSGSHLSILYPLRRLKRPFQYIFRISVAGK
jgi:hypothetical protein